MTARARYRLLRHPRVGRSLLIVAWLHLLASAAVCTAPAASASTNAVVLNWTGLHDSYGVPIGDFYLSLASFHDRLTQGGLNAAPRTTTFWRAAGGRPPEAAARPGPGPPPCLYGLVLECDRHPDVFHPIRCEIPATPSRLDRDKPPRLRVCSRRPGKGVWNSTSTVPDTFFRPPGSDSYRLENCLARGAGSGTVEDIDG